jgi:fluoride ion exporter CrcB/FEX
MRLVAVMMGGAAGALARWAIELAVPSVGGFPLLAIGFLGAYTTFSTMAMEGVRLLDQGRPQLAVGYWLATLLGGQMAGVWGMWLGRLRRPGRRHGVERRSQAAADLHR